MTLFETKNLSKEIKGKRIFSGVNLKVEKGECIALKCRNEIGIILLKTLIGESLPSLGEILYKNKDIHRKDTAFYQEMGASLLEYGLYERMTVRDYMNYFRSLYASNCSIEGIMKKAGLMDKHLNRIKSLTISQRRRLQMARLMINQPQFILLEEPTQNLDMESCVIIRRLLLTMVSQGTSILFTSSSLEEAEALGTIIYELKEDGMSKIDFSEGTQVTDKEQQKPTHFNIEKIPAKVNDKIILFNPLELIFIESSEGTSYLNTKEDRLPSPLTLTELEDRLKPFGFYRSHRSYLVNLQRVREVIPWSRNSYSLILDDEKETSVPLSKGRIDELKAILGL